MQRTPGETSAIESQPLRGASLAALGIVFGDLGTSPLYTLQTVVEATGGKLTAESAFGILSLLIWTLLITISVKYAALVMRADNRGEGGILALMSLIGANGFTPGVRILTGMGLLGAALIYGDGVITPAISVLSAVEGLNVVTTHFKPFVMPITVAILVGLFAAQHFGTARIGRTFGPIMLVWFAVIATLGVVAITRHPGVLAALDPRYALRFLRTAGRLRWLVLGGVFLCITGGEALYADMGHFGKKPIRRSWYFVVLPALLLSYAGQTAYLIDGGSVSGNPFFEIAPSWSIYPLVGLATVATIIASQSIITGSFSMTRQAQQLGWLPGVAIRQTSDTVYGQIYVPIVNWLMMAATVGTTIAFGSSARLAAAYGTAVSTTMLLTTFLLYAAMRTVWRWPAARAAAIAGALLIVDGGFFCANLLKIADGGWLPLSFAAILFFVMVTWRAGVEAIRGSLAQTPQDEEKFLAELASGRVVRVDGTTIFLTRSAERVPRLIMDHLRFAGALPRHIIALSVVFEAVPRMPPSSCAIVDQVAEGFWHVVARFGFVEIPDLRRALRQIPELATVIDLDSTVFVGSRDLVVHEPRSKIMSIWRLAVFAFLYRNSAKIIDRFHLPARNVIEIARQIAI